MRAWVVACGVAVLIVTVARVSRAGGPSCTSANADGAQDANVVCVDTTDAVRGSYLRSMQQSGDTGVLVTPASGVLRPNHPTVVNVLILSDERATIALTGTAGATAAKLYQVLGLDGGANSTATSVFAPRIPGAVTLTVNVFARDATANDKPRRSFTAELYVPMVYFGALRVGLSSVFGAADHSYATRMDPGSAVNRVIENPYRPFMTELVLGYALYPQAFTQERGRMYVPGRGGFWNRLSPYFGLGVVSASPASTGGTKAAWLRSFYLGTELELAEGFSLAATLVARRADERATDVTVGGPIGSGATLTESDFRLGFAVVLNFSPDLFKFAPSIGAK